MQSLKDEPLSAHNVCQDMVPSGAGIQSLGQPVFHPSTIGSLKDEPAGGDSYLGQVDVPSASTSLQSFGQSAFQIVAPQQPPAKRKTPIDASTRRPCNCTKSQCLKLYCDCFAAGLLCENCNCANCMNNVNFQEERVKAVRQTLDRNPTAFHPKIGQGKGERRHTKGCNCKKSGCLKNYCECYEAKISCTDLCRCQGCRNTEESMERRSLMRLAAMQFKKQNLCGKKMMPPAMLPPLQVQGQPHSLLTPDVMDAIVDGHLLAKAAELESSATPAVTQEKDILSEFGQALRSIIEEAARAASLPSNNPFLSSGNNPGSSV